MEPEAELGWLVMDSMEKEKHVPSRSGWSWKSIY